MGTVALPISDLVNVQVSVAAAAAQAQNTTSMLLLTNNNVIDMKTRILKYSSLSDVQAAFGASSTEAGVAALWFGQIPIPTDLLIGKWAQTPTQGLLVGGNLSQQQQQMSNWTRITAGKFQISINGTSTVVVSGLNFATQTNLNGVASLINAAMVTAGVAAVCTWDGNNFQFATTLTGPTAQVAPLVAIPADANDISAQLLCQVASPGCYAVPGAAAESATDALSTFDLQYGYSWYAVMIPQASDNDQISCAQAVQAMTTKHFYACTSMDPNCYSAGSTTDLAYKLSQLQLSKTAIQFSSSSGYAVASMMARILTTDYSQNNSVITLMYKQEPGVAAEYLNRTQLDALLAKNCNVFVAYQGGSLIIQPGTTCATNQFIDAVVGIDNLAIDIQLALFNLLYTSLTKVPQTDAGMNQLVGAAETELLNYVADGLIGPGTWTGGGFGTLTTGKFLDKGYYIYCPPLAQQSQADRAARMAGPIKIGVKLAGAIHTVNATIEVNP